MVDVHLSLLYEELDDLEVESLDCIEDGGLLLQIEEFKVASEFKQESKSGEISMNGSEMGQVKTILDAFVDSLRIRLTNTLDSLQVITLNSREKLGVVQFLVLDGLDNSVELGAEYQGIELVLKVLFELIVEV